MKVTADNNSNFDYLSIASLRRTHVHTASSNFI